MAEERPSGMFVSFVKPRSGGYRMTLYALGFDMDQSLQAPNDALGAGL